MQLPLLANDAAVRDLNTHQILATTDAKKTKTRIPRVVNTATVTKVRWSKYMQTITTDVAYEAAHCIASDCPHGTTLL